ncbi:methyltransferase family protein [Streptomyces parvus]|uniref:methyltransferase family protein n=1 Tax=Streptomyces parvus TaxID=66428 RepID=UPI0038073563
MTDGQDQEPRSNEDAPVDWQARGALSRLVLGQMATQALGAAVRFDVFDRIGPGTLSADALAESLGTHPQATLRLLRALAGLQLLSETEPGLFRTTAAGEPAGGVSTSPISTCWSMSAAGNGLRTISRLCARRAASSCAA